MKNPLLPLKTVIKKIRSENSDVKTYRLSLNGVRYDARPGQFNMVGYPGVGEAPISLSSLVCHGEFEHTIKAVGRVTRFLERFKEGDELFIRGPYGMNWPLDGAAGNDILLVTGGAGLAPIRSVIQEILRSRDDFENVSLIHGSRNPEDIFFKDEFDIWRKSIEMFLTVDAVPPGVTWSHHIGIVTDLLDKPRVKKEKTYAFICGPEIMMRFVSRGLLLRGFLPTHVYVSLERRMRCGIGQCGHCQHGSKFVCKDGPVFLYRDVSRFPDGIL